MTARVTRLLFASSICIVTVNNTLFVLTEVKLMCIYINIYSHLDTCIIYISCLHLDKKDGSCKLVSCQRAL